MLDKFISACSDPQLGEVQDGQLFLRCQALRLKLRLTFHQQQQVQFGF